MAILKSIIDGKIYPPSYFKEDVPESVERILMKALEKDKEKRYQSAWEMQFDIDTYLASSEFTPSNIHLSNFLKQIFGDEIEREKELLIKDKEQRETEQSQRANRPGGGGDGDDGGNVGVEHEEEVLELEEVGGRALTDSAMPAAGQMEAHQEAKRGGNGANGHHTSPGRPRAGSKPGKDGELRLKLTPGELEALQKIADAHKTTIDQVVRDMLRSHLKYMT
jgi:hypothetical protein